LRFFESEFASHGDAEAVGGPRGEGDMHDAQHAVHAPQGAVFLPGGASAIAITGESFAMKAGFFLGRIVEAAPDDLACGDQWGCAADHGAPEGPAAVVERAPKEDIEA
jgi:hypothetical protein